jgi:hypothetical protein
MICIARTLGAPVSVPAGNWPERIHRGESFSQLTIHLTDEMQHVGVALDNHQLADADGAVSRDSTNVVSAQIDQHEMLGAFLFVGDELGGHPCVILRRSAATACAGDRPERHLSTRVNAHEQLG